MMHLKLKQEGRKHKIGNDKDNGQANRNWKISCVGPDSNSIMAAIRPIAQQTD
jgi:hypothetical protein